MHYCQLRFSREAIQMLAETKGQIPNSYVQALKDIKQRNAIISEKDAVISEKDAVIIQNKAIISEKDAIISQY